MIPIQALQGSDIEASPVKIVPNTSVGVENISMDNIVGMIKSTTDVCDREGSTGPFSSEVSSMKQIAQLLVSNTTCTVKHFLSGIYLENGLDGPFAH